IRSRWLVDIDADWVGLPSRTHRDALAGLLDAATRGAVHVAAANVIEAEDGPFGGAEAAWHAAQAGDGARAGAIALEAAHATAAAALEASTTQLVAYARRADPSCEEPALQLIAGALSRSPSQLPPAFAARAAADTNASNRAAQDSEPPT